MINYSLHHQTHSHQHLPHHTHLVAPRIPLRSFSVGLSNGASSSPSFDLFWLSVFPTSLDPFPAPTASVDLGALFCTLHFSRAALSEKVGNVFSGGEWASGTSGTIASLGGKRRAQTICGLSPATDNMIVQIL
jgi:hypothetical protein